MVARRLGVVWWVCMCVVLSACAQVGAGQQAKQNYARVHTELAARYLQVGQFAVAVEEARLALNRDQSYIPAHTLMALLYGQLRQDALAQMHFKTGLALSAEQGVSDTDLRNSYAWYLCQNGHYSIGLNELSVVLKDPLYESMDKALVNAALCSARMMQLTQAQGYIQAALDMRPEYAAAMLYQAHIQISLGRAKEVLPVLSKLRISLGAESAQMLWLQARLDYVLHHKPNGWAAQQLLALFPIGQESVWLREGAWQGF